MKPSKTRARLGMIGAMGIFGSIGLFVRVIPLSSAEIALFRAVLALLLLGGVLLYKKRRSDARLIPEKRDLLWLGLSGAAMGFNWILLFEAYRYTTVSTATLSYYFAPILVTVLTPILFRERFTVRQIVCFAVSTVGIVLLTGIEAVEMRELIGIAFGLGAACLYAAVVLINKGVGAGDAIAKTAIQFAAAIVVLSPYVLFTDGIRLGAMTAVGWSCLLSVGLLHTGVTYCVYFASLRGLPGQEAAILSYIDPLVAVLLSVFVLGERITAAQIVGGVLILGCSILYEILSNQKQNQNI